MNFIKVVRLAFDKVLFVKRKIGNSQQKLFKFYIDYSAIRDKQMKKFLTNKLS